MSAYIFLNASVSPVEYVTSWTQRVFLFPKSLLYSAKVVIFSHPDNTLTTLKAENKKLSEQLAEFGQLKKDNDAYKSQFAESGASSSKILAARVIGLVGSVTAPMRLVIDQGSENGIKQNMTVVEGKQFVGRIGSVSPRYSLVDLPLSSDFSTVGDTSLTNAEGIIKGEGDFILFDDVLITDSLKKDDVVVTKGNVQANGVGIEPGYIVGKIVAVSRVESRPFQNAELQSFVDFSKLSQVFVVVQ